MPRLPFGPLVPFHTEPARRRRRRTPEQLGSESVERFLRQLDAWRAFGELRPDGSDPRRPTPLERIEEQLERDGANGHWYWHGRVTPQGYPQIYAGRPILVRRFLWELEHGPLGGRVLRFGSGDANCVNPEHATVLTRADVAREIRAKPGGPSRLTPDAVREARHSYAEGASVRSIASSLGVTERHVRRIVTGARWATAGVADTPPLATGEHAPTPPAPDR